MLRTDEGGAYRAKTFFSMLQASHVRLAKLVMVRLNGCIVLSLFLRGILHSTLLIF